MIGRFLLGLKTQRPAASERQASSVGMNVGKLGPNRPAVGGA